MSINKLNDNELIKQYQVVRTNFLNVIEGTIEESQIEKLYDKIFKEIINRNIDLRICKRQLN